MERLRQKQQYFEVVLDLLAETIGMTPKQWEDLKIKALARASLDEIHEIVEDLPKAKTAIVVETINTTDTLTNLIRDIRNESPKST